jgi:3-methylcrotonyl-CoA carboxylase alpha subunit
MNYFEIEIAGELKRVFGQMVGQNLWFHFDGQTYMIEASSRRNSTHGKVLGDGTVVAPMPGKILKVLCRTGQSVKSGELLVVMEAMKMEYSFTAEFDGKVETVGCKEGEQVSVSQVLVKVTKGMGDA